MHNIFLGETRKRIRVRIRLRVRIRVGIRVKSPFGDDEPTSRPVLKIWGHMSRRQSKRRSESKSHYTTRNRYGRMFDDFFCRCSAIINNQSKTNPLLRLKEKERISVQLGGGERKEVDINPLNFDVKEVTEKMSDLFGEGDYELKVEGEVITANNWVKCLKGEAVKVSKIEKETVVPATEHRGYRGIGLTR